MPLRTALEFVLEKYKTAINSEFKGHPIAAFMREDLPKAVQGALNIALPDNTNDYDVKGSSGTGNWATCPWCAILDPKITTSPQRGFYPVYLFREDFTGVYLSLNQGVTEIKERYKTALTVALEGRAVDFRNRLGGNSLKALLPKIDLRPVSGASISTYYAAGNIAAIFYAADALPSNEVLVSDLAEIVAKYKSLISSKAATGATHEPEELDDMVTENLTISSQHKRIERDPKIAEKVKNLHGFKCEACGFFFPEVYPGIDKSHYIEAHHLVPVSESKVGKVRRNLKTDFAVLCANCHCMIHRYPIPGDLDGFRKTLKARVG